jgi:nicotinate (nicotinamide) nucleotide adenylyltransferase
MKIGLLGGTFNPIHNGHLEVAKAVMEHLSLDEIWFLPTGNHPFKTDKFVLSYETRYALIEKAIADNPKFAAKSFDAPQKRFNYTADLMKYLYSHYQSEDFYFIIGEDNVKELPYWHKFEWLLKNVKFVVINRSQAEIPTDLAYLKKLIFFEMKPVDISSTQIRKDILAGKSIQNDVPIAISSEIYKLYSKKGVKMKEISTTKAPQALGAYSQAVEKNGFVYLSGQLGINPETNELEKDFEKQVKQTFANIKAVLSAADCTFSDVVKVSVFLQDMNNFTQLNSLYQTYFTAPYPAREAVEVARLPRDAEVEISIIAMR